MISTDTARLLVLSDLHAHSHEPDAGGATSLSFHGSAEGVSTLFDGLVLTLEGIGVKGVDAVVCPGDLTERCDTTALPLVWKRLCDLADHLGAVLVATAGNHDHARSGGEPKRFLINLEPPFPVRDVVQKANYFAYGFARSEVVGHTVICLNSAAQTGLTGLDGDDESRHGRVTEQMVSGIASSLAADPAKGIGILVVHHHPVQLPVIDLNETSRMVDAELLLEALAGEGPWVIIHGHKHRPWIQYAPGGGGSPVLFSAGSFAAPLDGVLAQSTKNQFYLVELLGEAEAQRLSLGPAGKFSAWSHSPLEPGTWIPSGRSDGLPAKGGFGWRADPSRLARLVAAQVEAEGVDQSWEQLVLWEPRLPYLSPDDWTKFDRQLTQFSDTVKPHRDADGLLQKVMFLRTDQS